MTSELIPERRLMGQSMGNKEGCGKDGIREAGRGYSAIPWLQGLTFYGASGERPTISRISK